jgi:hypothetical protein
MDGWIKKGGATPDRSRTPARENKLYFLINFNLIFANIYETLPKTSPYLAQIVK